MNYPQLLELAKKKKLILHKYSVGHFKRARYYYSDEPDILDQKLISVKYFPFTRYSYFARTLDMPQHQNYKIK